jgi:uncharacterized protein (TIGR03437 family)
MKHFGFLFLTAALAHASSDFMTGQAARLVIGQDTFTAQDTGSPTQYQLGGVSGIAYVNNVLFVVDDNRVAAGPDDNRVLIYNNINNFVTSPTASIPQGLRCPVCAGSPDTRGADVVVGQTDFVSTGVGLSQSGLRTPTSVASDGQILVIADTDNNRVLIWKSIPTTNGSPADLVLGQPDFKTVQSPPPVNAKSFRGPQGVWIQGTRLFVADTQNNRVMVWNQIPTSNNQAADYVLGAPNFTTAPVLDLTQENTGANASNMLSPVSVTSDGIRLFVADLGFNRVLVWNKIPTGTQTPADFALGQPDLVSEVENNSFSVPATPTTDADGNTEGLKPVLCQSNGTDSNGTATFPERCFATLSYPRYALSDGTRLYVADGGNDRVLIWSTMPRASGAPADIVIGQLDDQSDQVSYNSDTFRPDANIVLSAANAIQSPMALAWDGNNLYVSDPYDRRVLVFTPGANLVAATGVANGASRAVYAIGAVDLSGTITAKDTVTITINSKDYTYTVVKTDTLENTCTAGSNCGDTVVTGLVDLINAGSGDPNVIAVANPGFDEVDLIARVPGNPGNNVTYSASTSTSATITATAAGANLAGGDTAAEVAPGTLVTINGSGLATSTVTGTPDANGYYPTQLAGVKVYFDGIQAPLLYVSPTQINTQVPFEVQDASSVTSYAVIQQSNGSLVATTNVNIPIVLQNPGVFAVDNQPEPRPVIAYHSYNYASAVVDFEGTITANDTATITINSTPYTYTVQSSDTLASIRDALAAMINANTSEVVSAVIAGQFNRIILFAKAAGAAGEGITIAASNSTTANITLTALQTSTCCDSTAGAPVTNDNPAVPGEIITIYATGLGLVQPDDTTAPAVNPVTGQVYNGPPAIGPGANVVEAPVDNAQVGGKTANVLFAGLQPGTVGVYAVQLQLDSGLTTNPLTQLYIAQNVFTSNIVTIPITAPPSN